MTSPTGLSSGCFRDQFCERFGYAPDAFEKAIVRRCFPPLARPLGSLLLGLNPQIFARELAMVARLGRALNEGVVRGELDGYAYENARDKRFRARSLGLRLSRRRFIRIFREVMGEAAGPRPSPTPPTAGPARDQDSGKRAPTL